MSINYDSAKKDINKILEQISSKHSWSEASFHLRSVLRIIDDLAKREARRNDKVESQNWVLKNGKMMSPSEAKKAIKKIDNLIELESEKIKSRAGEQHADDTTLID